MTYLHFCEENAGPELGFDYRRGQIMPNLWKVIKCGGQIMPNLWKVIKCGGQIMLNLWKVIKCGGQIMLNLWKVIKCVVPRGLCMRSSKSPIQA
jgi:hypothetical protein